MNLIKNVVLIFELVGIPLAVIALFLSLIQTNYQKDELVLNKESVESTNTIQAWQLLANKTSGNSGKSKAISHLLRSGEKLTAIDISCEAMGGGWNRDYYTCARPTIIDEIKLNIAPTPTQYHFLNYANLSGSAISNFDIINGSFIETNISGSSIVSSNIKNSRLFTTDFTSSYLAAIDFSNSSLISSNFTNAALLDSNLENVELNDVIFRNTELSGTDFSKAEYVEKAIWENAWAWSDNAPKGLDVKIKLCDPKIRNSWYLDNKERSIDGIPPGC